MISITNITSWIGDLSLHPEIIDQITKATILLLMAWGMSFLLRRGSASARHQMWTAALLAVLALPLLSRALPTWRVPVFSAPASLASETVMQDQAAIDAAPIQAVSSRLGEVVTENRSNAGSNNGGTASHLGWLVEAEAPSSSKLLPLLWALGALLFLARLLVSSISAAKLARESTPVTDTNLVMEVRTLCRQLGIRSAVALVENPRITMPMAWGVFRQTVLLPTSAHTWPEERRRVVLLHELAHLKRWDCQTLLLARLVTALHWFNPLVWFAVRRLQAEREHACDDLVLTAGTPGADYAQHLLDIARAVRSSLSPGWAMVAMARPSELEGRLLAILDPNLDRGQTTRFTRLGVLAIAFLVLPLASLEPRARAEEASSEPAPAQAKSEEPAKNARVIEAFAVALQDEKADTRAQAAHSLGMTEDPAALPALRAALSDPSPDVRQQAIWALGMLESKAATPELAAALTDNGASVRQQAAWALGMLENEAAVPELSAALADDNTSVRHQVAWALGMIESEAAVPALATALTDADASVRHQVAWALGMIESDAATDSLTAALSDDQAEVRQQAAWALGMIENPSAVSSLTAALQTDTSPEVREKAAWALGMIGDEAALDPLLDAMSDDSLEVRQRALWAVGQISG